MDCIPPRIYVYINIYIYIAMYVYSVDWQSINIHVSLGLILTNFLLDVPYVSRGSMPKFYINKKYKNIICA